MEKVTFIPTEYIFGNIMVSMYKLGFEKVSISEIFRIGSFVQRNANEKDVKIILLLDSSHVKDLKLNFSEYFTINEELSFVEINPERNIVDFQARFVGYIPFEPLIFLIEQIGEYVLSNVELKNDSKVNVLKSRI